MQKNKIVLISAFIVIILVILVVIYILGQNKAANFDENMITGDIKMQNNEAAGNGLQGEAGAGNQTEINNTGEKNKLVTGDFSMDLPEGWKGVPNTLTEVTAMAANVNEDINDSAAKTINFKSYLAVSSDLLGGKTMNEYMVSLKNELQAAVPDIVFINENSLTISEKPSRAIEAEMIQQGVNFKVLIIAIQGNDDDVWVLSYNTVKSRWDGYAEAFAASAKSFILKK